MKSILILLLSSFLFCFHCPEKQKKSPHQNTASFPPPILTGADQIQEYLPLLKNKKVGLVVNHTSMIHQVHLADSLKSSGVHLSKIFAPEHGFRGNADAGEHIKDGIDTPLKIPVVSLYGNNKKPTAEQLADVDVLLFDMQDVGVRFYTYISTLHYIMEAAAEQNKKLIVLDRPNPNGNYIDGPVLDTAFRSFVGMHPIPVVHGLTIGELAQMINGEKWLNGGITCDLSIIPIKNWAHNTPYSLPVKPSPNLPNDQSIKLYPSMGFFEGTVISVGRGTQTPFEIIGHPKLTNMPYQFTPVSIEGMSKNPPYQDVVCYGYDLRQTKVDPGISLKYLLEMYQRYPDKKNFFNGLFDKLAGTNVLKKQIISGASEAAIKKSWRKGLDNYRKMRTKYMIYQ